MKLYVIQHSVDGGNAVPIAVCRTIEAARGLACLVTELSNGLGTHGAHTIAVAMALERPLPIGLWVQTNWDVWQREMALEHRERLMVIPAPFAPHCENVRLMAPHETGEPFWGKEP